jgi:hypothetical protein
MRLVSKALSTILGSILLFAGVVNLFGLITTALITVIGALALWIVVNQAVNQAVERASAQHAITPPPQETSTVTAMRTRVIVPPTLHSVCYVGPHKVNAGEVLSILLSVKQGQRVKGHLEEVDGQPFDWYIADEKNIVLLKKGERRKFDPIDSGNDDPAYTVSRKIPWNARWFLILDTYMKRYSRKVRVDFEPVGSI